MALSLVVPLRWSARCASRPIGSASLPASGARLGPQNDAAAAQPKRQLRTRLSRDWAALGVDWHPDSRLPALSKFLAMLDELVEAVAELERDGKG